MLLVLGCATGGVLLTLHLDDSEPVLVLGKPVAAGQELTAADLREAGIPRGSGLDAVAADESGAVVGRQVAYSLPAGTLLTKNALGSSKVPPAGRAVAAVGLKPGQFPTGLQAGHHAVVVAAADEHATGSPASFTKSWTAVVTEVRADNDDQVTVVTFELAEGQARELAAAQEGTLRVVIVRGGGER
ncbi:SAF domain-containing protein [Streptomyces sp. AN091965]|uniref:SAF domain-containing protein n=1 Tax=Streptomyces sp. AN091965 TaxID=2927803 RepID=UPI001F61F3BC|nr:SAF domain-containing protein [Streptomyces sp. AN091965]MCI3928833.1 SAF domain-containing protein [Streptomyces sp. AN091965]